MTTIKIPASVEDATRELGGIDALLTAKQWARAAIVFAFTEDGQGRRTDLARKGAKLSLAEFAQLGIAGLTKRDTVAAYRQAWADFGTGPVEPGQRVTLPDTDWPGRTDPAGQRRYVEKDPAAMARAMRNRPEHEVEAFAQDLDDETAAMLAARLVEDRPDVAKRVVGPAIRATVVERRPSREHEDHGDFLDWAALFAEPGRHLRRLIRALADGGPSRKVWDDEAEERADELERGAGFLRAWAKGESVADGAADFLASLTEGGE